MTDMTRKHARAPNFAKACGRSAHLPAVLLPVVLAGCTVGPNFVRPTPETPAHWSSQATAPNIPRQLPPASRAVTPQASTVTEQAGDLGVWWRSFDDPLLDSLIERALTSNLDLRAAVLRIEEARAQRAIAAAAYWPALALDTSYSRQRFSETTPTGSLFSSLDNRTSGGITVPNPYNQFQLSADASWEIDLFGRVRRSVEASEASLQVSVEDHRAVLVSVLADVARNYMELRGAQERLRTAKENLATINELLDLTRKRRAAGLTTHIDVANAAAQSAETESALPGIEREVTESINQLSQLLAREPEALRAELGTPRPVPLVPATMPIGLPAELVRRRPDIREAEATLHVATAQIGVAVADLFPRVTLAGNGGFQSQATSDLLTWASHFGSIGPSVDLPIFDRGRWKTVRLYDLRAQEAALAYRRAVLNALHEVEHAIAAYGADQQRRFWLEATVAQNRDALGLSRQRYEGGLITFIDVLDVERTLQQNQLSLADTITAEATDLVRLYRSLGGGWQPSSSAPDATVSPRTIRGDSEVPAEQN
jgi:NodT family efflux transporter outer membrane factor (OMF) lipoprotein